MTDIEKKREKKRKAEAYRKEFAQNPSRRSKSAQHEQESFHKRQKQDSLSSVRKRGKLAKRTRRFRK